MGITIAQLKDAISRRAHKDLGQFVQEQHVEYWAKSGIEKVEQEEAWYWNKSAITITLIADTYEYAWPTNIRRYDAKSFHYGSRPYLGFLREPTTMDDELGPTWRLASGTAGSPRFFCEFGRAFWIGPKPSTSFVASNPTIYYYGWKTDLPTMYDSASTDATTLMIPYEAVDLYTTAALVAGLQQEDDPDWVRFEDKFRQEVLRKRAMNTAYNIDDYLEVPQWSKRMRF